jgi:predicted site-specific integrase-resolvase
MAEFERFIFLDDAAKKYGIHVDTLVGLVEEGQLRAVRVNRKIAIAENEVFDLIKQTVAGRARYATLEGKPIRVSEASEKYQIPHATLSKWAKRGYIRVIEQRRRLLLLNEADIARAKDLAERLGMKGGRGVITGPVYSI